MRRAEPGGGDPMLLGSNVPSSVLTEHSLVSQTPGRHGKHSLLVMLCWASEIISSLSGQSATLQTASFPKAQEQETGLTVLGPTTAMVPWTRHLNSLRPDSHLFMRGWTQIQCPLQLRYQQCLLPYTVSLAPCWDPRG